MQQHDTDMNVHSVFVLRLNGHAKGPHTPPRPTIESNGVLTWAYPSAGGPPTRPGSASKTRHTKHGVIAAYGAADTVPSIHYMAAGLSLAALALHGVTEGWNAAEVMVSDGVAVSSVAVPLCLTGIVKGAAAGILASVFCRQRPLQAGLAAAVVAMFAPIAALVTLAQTPLGRISDAFVLDASGLTSKATAATLGALLTQALLVLTPIASRIHQQASLKGLFSGAACAGVLLAARGLLCVVSPYCIHTH